MIPSVECREIPELVEFDLLDSDNKVINIKRFGEPADIYKENVSLLLDGNDLTDKTGKTITHTGVRVDTSVKKYGSGSLKFNSKQLLILSTDFTFGSNDLTIEGWFNFASLPSDFMLFDAGGYLTANGVSIEYFNNKLLMNYNNNQWIFSNNSLIINTWYHIAVTRNNNTIYLYLDGIKIAQVVMTQSFDSDNKISLGCAKDLRWPMNGYIDDFRITKGIARYTANFTPPNELSYVININEHEQVYRIHPVIKIQETTTTPKFYLGSKYQRNIMEVLTPALKTKRTIYNLKDMYLVDDICINTLEKINILLETDQMIKFTERLYNFTPLREKLNAELILEYLSTPVSGSSNSDIASTLKTSLIEDYHFTQEEIDNLNDNLNTFKSRARIALATPTIDNDKFRFNLPKTFIDGNRSKTEKKNLLVFGTDAGFNKFNLAGYSTPYSNISKRDPSEVLDFNTLTTGLNIVNINPILPNVTKLCFNDSLTELTGKIVTQSGCTLSTTKTKFNPKSIYINNGNMSVPAGTEMFLGTEDFTIETMVNLSSISDQPLLCIGQNQEQLCFLMYVISNGSILFRAGGGGWWWEFSSDRYTTAGMVTINTWNHLCVQRKNGILTIFVNGVVGFSGAWTFNIPNGKTFYIGSYVGGSNITAYFDYIRLNKGYAVYPTTGFNPIPLTENTQPFKDILTKYKQQIPFTYIPLSTDPANTNNEPVFENLTDITGFNHSDIVIDIPNVL